MTVAPFLDDFDVHIWRIDLAGEPGPGMDATLDASERKRAMRFKFSRDRNRFLSAHHAMRILLGRYLGVPPQAVPIVSGPHDKPVLHDRSLGFNLSHSGDCGLLAISRKPEIGVDVELLRLPSEARKLAESVCSAAELKTLAAVPDEGLAEAFFNCWTRKEAYLKALGVGLSLAPATITVGTGHAPVRVSIAARDVHQFVDVVSINGFDDCAAAVGVVGGLSCIHVFDHGSE